MASTGPQLGSFQPLGNASVLLASLLSSPQEQVVSKPESELLLSQSTLPSCDNHQYDKKQLHFADMETEAQRVI